MSVSCQLSFLVVLLGCVPLLAQDAGPAATTITKPPPLEGKLDDILGKLEANERVNTRLDNILENWMGVIV